MQLTGTTFSRLSGVHRSSGVVCCTVVVAAERLGRSDEPVGRLSKILLAKKKQT